MKKRNIDGVTMFLVGIFIIILIFLLTNHKAPELQKQDPIRILSTLLIIFFIAKFLWGDNLKIVLKPKKDSYHPTNYSAHSDFMNYGYLK